MDSSVPFKTKAVFLFLIIFLLVENNPTRPKGKGYDYLFRLPDEVSFAPDISCLIADLKYDGNGLKILEFGNITYSAFKGHKMLYGKSKVWEALWDELKSYNVPVWFISHPEDPLKQEERCFDRLSDIGIRYKGSTDLLLQDDFFCDCLSSVVPDGGPKCIDDCKGVVVLKDRGWPINERSNYFIVLNRYIFKWANDKLKTSLLFGDNHLKNFKPRWKLYPKQFSDSLVKKIQEDFKEYDKLVIKPLHSTVGNGIIIFEKKDLEKIVKKILVEKDTIDPNDDPSYSHWLGDSEQAFLVESFEESKAIVVQNKRYDATMRVIFVLSCSGNKIGLKFLGSYWKLPKHSLDDDCGLQEKYKSKIVKGFVCSEKVSDEDITHVKEILADVLPKMYLKVLQKEQVVGV